MDMQIIKQYPTIACCGIDCGLCPRYYTHGESRCPGCLGEKFFDKHPSCSIATCCFKKSGFETCADCPQFPCEKIRNWDVVDSFVTHKRSLENLRQVKESGIGEFAKQQQQRIAILENLITGYDDGKSKSFFCLAAALLELDDLNEAMDRVELFRADSADIQGRAKQARRILLQRASLSGIELVYRRNKA